jgi:polar amino acid transport system permease protein
LSAGAPAPGIEPLLGALRALQFGAGGWGDELARGLSMTLMLAGSALPLGLLAGLALAFAIHSRHRLLNEPAAAFAGVFRGIPELLALFLVYFGGQRLLNLAVGLFGLQGVVEFNSFLAGVATLAVVFAAYASEVFLGILRTLDRSSLDAARALGIGRWPTLRFILLPELFRLGLPGLSNLWLSILKQSALVSAISGGELMRAGYLAASSTGHPIFFYGIVCLVYFTVTMASEAMIARLHRRLNRGRIHA